MIHYFIGNLGHACVIASFVSALAAAFSYWKSNQATNNLLADEWRKTARVSFWIHAAAVLGIGIALFVIIGNHYFEYHYAYSYSDTKLQTYYLISTFWNGQEGSFLLWMFWHAVLGLVLMYTQRNWEAPVMIVFTLVQAFLASMILGVVLPGIDLKLGSSPFILLREAMADPIFQANPNFIPSEGQGLNPLLQNYWMVIHPPTLFLGFAATLVPFAFVVAGLWQRQYRDWIKPALPWSLFAGAVLGLGILMGGYWAYETLNFGGYWNWDPVENAVYVPWLVLVASIHTMITYKNSETALKASMILVVSVFILILYSTFLTRSGILGDASVHSFTDLGLSGQLFVYMMFFLLAAVALLVIRWKEIPTSEKEISVYSREFWIFAGATALCLMGFQVLLPTSFPVINKVLGLIGIDSKMATPGNQVAYYSNIQIWFAIAVALLSGTGQFFWWKRMDKSKLKAEMLAPVLITLILWAIVIAGARIYQPSYLLLSLAGLYIIVSSANVLRSVIKVNRSLAGGALAHIGVGLMLVGILFSAGYSRIVSLNNSGIAISNDLPDDFNRENLLLFLNEPRGMAGYDIEYKGERIEPRSGSGYIKKNDVYWTDDLFRVVAKKDILINGNLRYRQGDTIEVRPENTYYEIQMKKEGKLAATLYPRTQINPDMGGFLASPDIKRNPDRDIYTHVSNMMNPQAEPDWRKQDDQRVKLGQEFFANDYVAVMESISRLEELEGVELGAEDVAVKARIRVEGEYEPFYAEPIFVIKDRTPGVISSEIPDLGIRLTLVNIHPETSEFTIGLSQRQKNWVVIKAVEKPFINVLWLGTGVLMMGFFMAMIRRFREFRQISKA
ncbi:MAG: cytochrome c biogenesis protein CcsA [Cyclobacteriaceae bacterium]|nr:cytochrome c biogenesis protein CcsA [Cyclobacteriaceae bacterium]